MELKNGYSSSAGAAFVAWMSIEKKRAGARCFPPVVFINAIAGTPRIDSAKVHIPRLCFWMIRDCLPLLRKIIY